MRGASWGVTGKKKKRIGIVLLFLESFLHMHLTETLKSSLHMSVKLGQDFVSLKRLFFWQCSEESVFHEQTAEIVSGSGHNLS